MSKFQKLITDDIPLSDDAMQNFGSNYQIVSSRVRESLTDKVNPVTKRPYSGLDMMLKSNEILRSMHDGALRDMRPVGADEARQLFDEYYEERSGKNADRRKQMDRTHRRKKVLKPNSPDSYLYRPLRDDAGHLIKSGPEVMDFEGVDDRSRKATVKKSRSRRSRK